MRSIKYTLAVVVITAVQALHPAFARAGLSEAEALQKFEAAKNLIHAYSGSGDNYEQATVMAREILEADANSPYGYMILAELGYRQYADSQVGSAAAVRELTRIALKLNSDLADPHVVNAKLYLLENKLTLARIEADEAIKIDSRSPEAMYAQARVAEREHRYAEAESWYRSAIETYTDKSRQSNIYYWLAQMLITMDPPDIPKARAAMQQSVDLSPDAPWKLVNYAIFLNRYTTDYATALEYADRALAVMDFRMARLAKGMAMYAMWAERYVMRVDASKVSRPDLRRIFEQTGVTLSDAHRYALKYMRQSKIDAAIYKLGHPESQ